jgi:hypothetical protein
MAQSLLTKTYRALAQLAEETGEDQARTLSKGARVTVRVRAGEVIVTVSRFTMPLGETELETFVKHCEIPPHARRQPSTSQGIRMEGQRTRYYVCFRWKQIPHEATIQDVLL